MGSIIILFVISFVVFLYIFVNYKGDEADYISAKYALILMFILFFAIMVVGKTQNQNTNQNTNTTTNQNIVIYKDIDKKAVIYCDYYPDTEICIELNKMSFKNLDNILTQEQKEKISNSVKDIENKIQNIKID